MTVEDLKKWADRCEREGRSAQALLVRNMAFEVEQGASWLEYMTEADIARIMADDESIRRNTIQALDSAILEVKRCVEIEMLENLPDGRNPS